MGVKAGGTLYLSGIGPADGGAPIADQTSSAMDRLGQTLRKAGLDYANVVSCHVHLADMNSYAEMNTVYGSYFPQEQFPARTTVEVPGLPDGAGIVLMCVAYSNSSAIEVVRPPESEIPPAMGPYSPAVRAGDTVYLSGQGGRNPSTGEIAESAGKQALQTLANIGSILRAAGLDYSHTALASSYFPPSATVEEIDGAFESVFDPGGAPSRTNVALSRLPGDIAAEVTFIAVRDNYLTRLFMHDRPPTAISSPASTSNGVAYVSAANGQGGTFREQFQDALEQQASALRLALLDLPHVVRMTVYLSDIANMEELGGLLSAAFPQGVPAFTALKAFQPAGSVVAVDMIAAK